MLACPVAQHRHSRWTSHPADEGGLAARWPHPRGVSQLDPPHGSASPSSIRHRTFFSSRLLLLPARKCCWIHLPAFVLSPKVASKELLGCE